MAYRYVQNKAKDSAEIYLYDDIGDRFGGVSAETILSDLQYIGDVKTLTIRIDSAGGDMRDGNNIYNQFRRHSAHKIVQIDGWAASIASVIATAGDEVVISDNGRVMIHRPWALVAGTADELRAEADVVDSLETDIIRAYQRRINKSDEEIRSMLTATTWFNSQQAVDIGFADSINEATLLAASCADLKKYKYPEPPESIKNIDPVTEFPRRQSYAARFASVDKFLLKHRL